MILRYSFNPYFIISNVIYYDHYRKTVHISKSCWNELFVKLILRCVPLESRKEKVRVLKKIISIAYKKYVLQNKQEEAIVFFNENILHEFGELEDEDKIVSVSQDMIEDVVEEEETSFEEEYVGGESIQNGDMSIELYSRISNFQINQSKIENQIMSSLNQFLVTSKENHMVLIACGFVKMKNAIINFLNFGSFIPKNECEKLFIKNFMEMGYLYHIRNIYQENIADCSICNVKKYCIQCERNVVRRCDRCTSNYSQHCSEQCTYSNRQPHTIYQHPNFENEIDYKFTTSFNTFHFSHRKDLNIVEDRKLVLPKFVKFIDCDDCVKLNPYNHSSGCDDCVKTGYCQLCVLNKSCSLHSFEVFECSCGSIYLDRDKCEVYGCAHNLKTYGPLVRRMSASALSNHFKSIRTMKYRSIKYYSYEDNVKYKRISDTLVSNENSESSNVSLIIDSNMDVKENSSVNNVDISQSDQIADLLNSFNRK